MGLCDKGDYKKVYLRYHTDVQRFVISRGVNHDQALDIVQESFLRLWEKCKEVKENSVKSFLFTISSRILIDQYRKNQTSQKFRLSLSWKKEEQDPQYQMEQDEFKLHFEEVLGSMNTGAREVFLLHRFENMKYREIAEYLAISVKAVEKRMHKAILHLLNNKIPITR